MKGLLPLLILLIVEFYSFQAIKTITKNKWVLLIYLVISIVLMLFIVYSFMNFDRGKGQNKSSLLVIGMTLLIYVPKILVFLIFHRNTVVLNVNVFGFFQLILHLCATLNIQTICNQ